MGDELARLRIEVQRQVKLRQAAAEELATERRNLMKEFEEKWSAFQDEVAKQVRVFADLKLECEVETRKLAAQRADLGRREVDLVTLRTALALARVQSGVCPTCGLAVPESPAPGS